MSLLVINDDTVAPHLELLRRVCDPQSRSKPHITVRYFDKLRVPQDHLDTVIPHIDLLRPGTFFSEDSSQAVVFLQCDADELVRLEHKPHFPTSEFHITLYEGADIEFAQNLLEALRLFPWMFRVPLAEHTTLTHVELKRAGTNPVRPRPALSAALHSLFFAVTKRRLAWSTIDALTNLDRLRVVRDICAHLHRSVSTFPSVVNTPLEEGSLGQEKDDIDWKPAVHLTPPELARAIATYALSLLQPKDAPIHFGDPAVGNGAFYAALLQTLPKTCIASAVGVDVNPRQVEAARSRWEHRGLHVVRADYLHLERLQPRTLILANPPYLRHQDIPTAYKRRLRERASVIAETLIDAKSGQYVYFLILSHRWLADGGVAAWLIPSGFMRSQYGRAVRRYLTEEVELIRIHQFGAHDPQFENAKVLPTVVVFRKGAPEAYHKATLSIGGSLEEPHSRRVVSIGALRNADGWTLSDVDGETTDVDLYIGDLFSVTRGIATGANGFFVLPREKARMLGLPDGALRPILPKSRRLKSDVVESDTDGWPAVDPQLCVIDCELSEENIAALYPGFSEYLARGRSEGILERNLVRSRKPWYRQEQRRPTAFLCTYMGRGSTGRLPLRFIWNKSNAIATNAYLMLYPRRKLTAVMRDRPRAHEEVFASLQRAASTTMGDRARTYSGGLRKIEPRELLRVGLPGVPEWLLQVGRARDSAGLWAEP